MNERHTADNISSYLDKVLQDWGIAKSAIVGIVTDNAANIKSAVSKSFSVDHHLGCFAHSLNLVVTTSLQKSKPATNTGISNAGNSSCKISSMSTSGGIIELLCSFELCFCSVCYFSLLDCEEEDIERIIKSVKRIVMWFHSSNVASNELKELTQLHIIQDCPTRWNSTYLMIERFLKLSSKVSTVLLDHMDAPPMISGVDIAVLHDIIIPLKLFYNATLDCSGDKSITISRVIPIHDFLATHLDEMKMKTAIGKQFLQKLNNEFKKRFTSLEFNYLCGISTVLDPRYKKLHFRDPLNCAKGNVCNNIQ